MGIIVAIGGGEIGRPGYPCQTTKIDKDIIKLSKKKHPKLLFIPTASYDSELYVKVIRKHYGKNLGCIVDVLYLLKENPSKKEIPDKILQSDIIYVGGGNTLKMMQLWRKLGVDKILKAAWKKGTVLCGISAGSICWFDSGHSDSMSFYDKKKWKYINVKGLGFLKGIHCPHYDSETLGIKRKDNFKKMIKKIGGLGIAIDNNCAIIFKSKGYKVINSQKNKKAYKVFKRSGRVVQQEITPLNTFSSLSNLEL